VKIYIKFVGSKGKDKALSWSE